MTENKRTIERYMQGFRSSNHAEILACLADDVEWVIPGAFHIRGKEAFDKEIENEAFTGAPEIDIARLVEEDDVVIAEGTVRARRADGTILPLAMCDVFEMLDGRIRP
jgi:ketosteroid isomerase-like protein